MQDLESMFDGWTEDLAHLTVLRESLSSYISSEDLCVLQERIELLQRQWEEICHQVLTVTVSIIQQLILQVKCCGKKRHIHNVYLFSV